MIVDKNIILQVISQPKAERYILNYPIVSELEALLSKEFIENFEEAFSRHWRVISIAGPKGSGKTLQTLLYLLTREIPFVYITYNLKDNVFEIKHQEKDPKVLVIDDVHYALYNIMKKLVREDADFKKLYTMSLEERISYLYRNMHNLSRVQQKQIMLMRNLGRFIRTMWERTQAEKLIIITDFEDLNKPYKILYYGLGDEIRPSDIYHIYWTNRQAVKHILDVLVPKYNTGWLYIFTVPRYISLLIQYLGIRGLERMLRLDPYLILANLIKDGVIDAVEIENIVKSYSNVLKAIEKRKQELKKEYIESFIKPILDKFCRGLLDKNIFEIGSFKCTKESKGECSCKRASYILPIARGDKKIALSIRVKIDYDPKNKDCKEMIVDRVLLYRVEGQKGRVRCSTYINNPSILEKIVEDIVLSRYSRIFNRLASIFYDEISGIDDPILHKLFPRFEHHQITLEKLRGGYEYYKKGKIFPTKYLQVLKKVEKSEYIRPTSTDPLIKLLFLEF